jgi:hypothetical protein
VVCFARERQDAVGFRLKVQAELAGGAILRLDEASFETVERRFWSDIDNTLGCHQNLPLNAATQQI